MKKREKIKVDGQDILPYVELLVERVSSRGSPFSPEDIQNCFSEAVDPEILDASVDWLVEHGWACRLPDLPDFICTPGILYQYDTKNVHCKWDDYHSVYEWSKNLQAKRDASGMVYPERTVIRGINKRASYYRGEAYGEIKTPRLVRN